jgi:plastocyanin
MRSSASTNFAARKGVPPMRRAITAPIACAALALLAGCGSSNSSSTGATKAASTAATTSTSGLKPTTVPKFGAPPASAPVRSGIVKIAYRNIAINPDTVKVKLGSTISWTNYDAVEHNVTSAGEESKIGQQKFASKNFGEGATFEIKAERPGVIHYLCTIHPASMNGTIVVVK